MSINAPRRFRLTREQLGPNTPDWVMQLLAQLNAFNDETVTAIEALAGNSTQKVITIQTGASLTTNFPLTFKHGLNKKPTSCTIDQVSILDNGAAPLGAVAINTWSVNGETITVGFINNLALNARVQITFRIS